MASVTQLRRANSFRLHSRPGMLEPVDRLQPLAEKREESLTAWARNLRNRTGWHGVRTRHSGVVVLFLMHLNRRTYYIHFRTVTATGVPRWMLDVDFSIGESVFELAHLETLLAADVVDAVWEFQVKGDPAGFTGICISVEKVKPITSPAPVPRKTAESADADDATDEDGELVVVGDCADEKAVVDTDAESVADFIIGSDTSSGDSVADLKEEYRRKFLKVSHAPEATKIPATGGPSAEVSRRVLPPLWSDEYFWVCDNIGADCLQMRVRAHHRRPRAEGGMGPRPMSKLVRPSDYAETRGNPIRSLLLLRAWAVWRAQLHGWADHCGRRKKYVADLADRLQRDIATLGAPCRLLGNLAANAVLREVAPEIVERLCHSTATGVRTTATGVGATATGVGS